MLFWLHVGEDIIGSPLLWIRLKRVGFIVSDELFIVEVVHAVVFMLGPEDLLHQLLRAPQREGAFYFRERLLINHNYWARMESESLETETAIIIILYALSTLPLLSRTARPHPRPTRLSTRGRCTCYRWLSAYPLPY